MSKKIAVFLVLVLTLQILSANDWAVFAEVEQNGVLQERALDSITADEIEADEALGSILHLLNERCYKQRSAHSDTWTGNIYSYTYTTLNGAKVVGYLIPYMIAEYADVGTAGTCTWYTELYALKTTSVNGVEVTDGSFINNLSIKNMQCRMECGYNTRLRNVNETSEPGTIASSHAFGADFGRKVLIEEGDFARLSADAVTKNSLVAANRVTYCAFQWSFDICCGVTTEGSVSFDTAQITGNYVSNMK